MIGAEARNACRLSATMKFVEHGVFHLTNLSFALPNSRVLLTFLRYALRRNIYYLFS